MGGQHKEHLSPCKRQPWQQVKQPVGWVEKLALGSVCGFKCVAEGWSAALKAMASRGLHACLSHWGREFGQPGCHSAQRGCRLT